MQVVRNVCLEKRCKNLSFPSYVSSFSFDWPRLYRLHRGPQYSPSAEVSFSSSRELRPSFALPLFPQETQNVLQLVFQPFFLLVTPSVVVFSLISIFVEPRNVF